MGMTAPSQAVPGYRSALRGGLAGKARQAFIITGFFAHTGVYFAVLAEK